MTARVIPIRQQQREPCAALKASIFAEQAALALSRGEGMAHAWRAEIIRAAAAGDAARVLTALEGWTDEQG